MAFAKNLNDLRKLMQQNKIDAYVITMSDPHLSEYVAEHYRIVRWFSGFSGSTGNLVVTKEFAGLWTDSRYFIQAEEQLKDSGIELVKLKVAHTPEFIDWLVKTLASKNTVAFDGKLLPATLVKMMEVKFSEKQIQIMSDCDFVSELWKERPELPQNEIFIHELKYAGLSVKEKLELVKSEMSKSNSDYFIISSLEDIAWLFNIRGRDIPYVPVAICYSVITSNESILFIDEKKIPSDVKKELIDQGIRILNYDEIFNFIKNIGKRKRISIQLSRSNFALYICIPKHCIITDQMNFTTIFKSVKSRTEIENIRDTMVKDGIAMVKFLYWLDKTIGKEIITEISGAKTLRGFRALQEGFFDESFSPISAFNAHAAMPHYSATNETDSELIAPGIYLIDSGGQYYGGTTDITRTITLGIPTQIQRDDFTIALKGTINLASAVFPYGTKGFQLDVLARKPLWDNGMNYGHGTGHGVGYFLSVHEGPQTIGTSASGDINTVLQPGMLISDEPAFYRDGEYGFRTENLILVVEHNETEFGKFLKFETVTLCPIDLNLINKELLNIEEIEWLNNYHSTVYKKLSKHLNENEQVWLKDNTHAI